MDAEVVERWNLFHGAVRDIYRQTDLGLEYRGLAVEEAELETLAGRSEDLTGALRERLYLGADREDAEVEELETATLAATAIDIAVAGDVTDALRQEAEGGEEQPPAYVPAAVEEAAPSRQELDPLGELLARADDTFPEAGSVIGAAPGSLVAERRARDAIDAMAGCAAPVATEFGTGLLTVGASHLLSALGAVEGIRNAIDELQGKAKYGFKLVDSGAGKLAGLVGVDPLIDVMGNVVFDQIEEALERRTHVGEQIVRWTVRVRRSEGMVSGESRGPGLGREAARR